MKDFTACEHCGYDFPANLTHLTDIDATGIICPKCQKEWEEEQKRKDSAVVGWCQMSKRTPEQEQIVAKMLVAYRNKDLTCTEGMSAALGVAIEELLGEPTEEETTWDIDRHEYVALIFANRRARFLKPRTITDVFTDFAMGKMTKAEAVAECERMKGGQQ